MGKITTVTLREMKKRREKIAVLTSYDYTTTKILNEAGVDVILVGDSLGMVKLGYENTLAVTLEDILYHCKPVKKGNTNALLVADMPFMSYEPSSETAIRNAGLLVKEGGMEAVKIEGGREIAKTIRAVIDAKIPVMGHIGLTPQSVNVLGGYKVQGKDSDQGRLLIETAKELEQAGVFSLVLECIPEELAASITGSISVPTIGIGAGEKCDGQVLVTDDVLGIYSDLKPKFVKRYANLHETMLNAVKEYRQEVKESKFPSKEYSYNEKKL
jgi:3-methyl-2-oxobutanoate hydroxymethyltransferase